MPPPRPVFSSAGGHWRDVLAFTWRLQTASGAAAIEAALAPTLARTKADNFHFAAERSPPRRVRRAGTDCIEAIFEFETAFGRANGVVRLVEEADGAWRAWTLLTTLEELHGYPDGRPPAVSDAERFSRDFGGENWLDQRRKAAAYADHDPAVLVVGGGQAGLAVAARLSALGVDTLIVDRHERIGDNWRKRYHALTLHNEVHVNHLPLMPFPPTWPVFIPKDKLANWFEAYVEALDLNYWTGTELAGGSYDATERRWTVTLRRSDGSERTLKPRHVIVATGVSGIPIWPSVPGLDTFAGTVMHSGSYTSGDRLEGPQRPRARHRQQRPRRGAGSLLQRCPRHPRAAQPDLYREHPRGAEGLLHLQRGPALRRLRPAGRVDALSGPAARLPAVDGGDARGRSRAVAGPRGARLPPRPTARTIPASR